MTDVSAGTGRLDGSEHVMLTLLQRLGGLFVAGLSVIAVFITATAGETRVGAASGIVQASETSKPLAGIRVLLRPKSAVTSDDILSTRTNGEGEWSFKRVPVGNYGVEIQAQQHTAKVSPLQIQEGEAPTLAITAVPGDPFVRINVHQHAQLTGEQAQISLHSFRQGRSLKMRLFRADSATLIRLHGGSVRSLLAPIGNEWDERPAVNLAKLPGVRLMREWSHPLASMDAEGVAYEKKRFEVLPPGVYLVDAHGEKGGANAWFMVTDLALITKCTEKRLIAFTMDLRTGAPVAGAEVRARAGDAQVGLGVTDDRGSVEIALGRNPNSDWDFVAHRGDSIAFTREYMGEPESQRYRVVTYTDRPIYRPGQSVHFKTLLRTPHGSGYEVPSPCAARIEVTDARDTELFAENYRSSEMGTFGGSFSIPSTASGGFYTLSVTIDGATYTDGFAVASYRKPEWQVDVTFDQPRHVRGDRVGVTATARYYYGAPVSDATLNYTIFRARRWVWEDEDPTLYDAESDEEGGYSDSYGEFVTEGEGRTDADGVFRFEFNSMDTGGEDRTADYTYNVEVEVSDQSQRSVSGRGGVVVVASETRLHVRPERWSAPPGSPVPITIQARDGQDRPAVGLSLAFTAALDTWDGVRSAEEIVAKGTLTTDDKGMATYQLRSTQPGLITFRVEGRDPRGNLIGDDTSIWVASGEASDLSARYPKLSVLLDRTQYAPGSTAQVLINTDQPGGTAILAVEAEEVLEYRMVPLLKRSTVVRLPVRPEFVPNVYITVCSVVRGRMRDAKARMTVDATRHKVKVRISSERETYRPGDTAHYELVTTTESGQPVSAEVSFGVVDEAIYALRPDTTDMLWKAFYPRRMLSVQTSFSNEAVYLGDADKDGASVPVRRKFEDTAFWQRAVQTDASGRASIAVQLPDNLTSWRATARAISADTRVGEATYNIKVAKELTLRLQTPRVVTEGDAVTFTAVTHNYSAAPLDVTVRMRVTGLEMKDPPEHKIRLEAGAAESVAWQLAAPWPGTARVTVTAIGGTLSDGMEMSLPVIPFARERVDYRTGMASGGEKSETLDLDGAAGDSVLTVRVSPTLSGTMLGSLDYLIDYPHGCTEQTMSSFLPDVLVSRTMADLGMARRGRTQALPEMVRAGLLRLYDYQHDDGGWGWWQNDGTDLWMTAYVLFGLQLAKDSGFAVSSRSRGQGLDRAVLIAKETEKSDLGQAQFLGYVLAMAKKSDAARRLLDRSAAKGVDLDPSELAYRALARVALGTPADRTQARADVIELWSRAQQVSGLYHWSDSDRYEQPFFGTRDTEVTAVVLKAVLAVMPDDERLPGVVRWLLLQRKGSRWESTRDTAFILFGLSDYLRLRGELHPDYSLTVRLNDQVIAARKVGPGDGNEADLVLKIPRNRLQPSNRLTVSAVGKGAAYYSAELRQWLRTASFQPESFDNGVRLTREYFLVEKRRDGAGRVSSGPAAQPSTRYRVGDRVLVRVTLRTDKALEYLMLEDPLPSGFEAQDRGEISRYDWDYWWSQMDARDDRMVFYVRSVLPGLHTFEYYLRPEQVGKPRALPAVIGDMYIPSVRVSTGETNLEVTR